MGTLLGQWAKRLNMITIYINGQLPQDGGGDGKMSREGISPNHYEESFKKEVVAFTRATSRKEATEK